MGDIQTGISIVSTALDSKSAGPWVSIVTAAVAAYRILKPVAEEWVRSRKDRTALLDSGPISYESLYKHALDQIAANQKDYERKEAAYTDDIRRLDSHIADLQAHLATLQRQEDTP